MDSTQLIDEYIAGIELVQRATMGLQPDQLTAHPIAGMWSIQEVISHLADSEALFAHRVKCVLAEERPVLPYADPARYAAALAYQARDIRGELELISAVRHQLARILRQQTVEAWQRVGLHSKDGEQSVEQLVRKAIDHLKHHVRWIEDKRRILLRS